MLALVAGRPFLTYLLDQIADAGIRRVVLSTGHLAEQFASVIGTGYRDLEIVYAHEEKPLGTGGAIRFAGGFADADQLLVMNGDSYCDADLSAYIDWHLAGGHDVSLMLAKVDDTRGMEPSNWMLTGGSRRFLKSAEDAPRLYQRGRVLAPPSDARTDSGGAVVDRTRRISHVARAASDHGLGGRRGVYRHWHPERLRAEP